MIIDPFAVGGIVVVAAVLAAHVSARVFLILLASFAIIWVLTSRYVMSDEASEIGLVLLFFTVASGLAVAAAVHMIRMFFRDRALSRIQITLAAFVGSLVATTFLVLIFSR